MGISEIYIVKRDGKRAPFSLEKIKRAISKAFLSVVAVSLKKAGERVVQTQQAESCLPDFCRSARLS